MANDNTLPISIVIDPSKAEAQVKEFVRTAESIFAASEARKVTQSTNTVRQTKQVNGEYQDWWKRSLAEQSNFEKMLRQAQVEDNRRTLAKQVSDQRSAAMQAAESTREGLQFEKMLRQAQVEDNRRTLAKQVSDQRSAAMQAAESTREGLQFEKMLRQAQIEDNRRMLQRQVADAKATQQQIAAAQAATPQGRLEGLLGGLGVRTPQQTSQSIKDVKEALLLLESQGTKSGVVVDQLNTKMRLLETGNARGRGELHKLTAAMASLTFELTGAVYGATMLGAIIGSGAIFGATYLKQIEDAKMGIAGTVLSMGMLNKQAMTSADALGISENIISRLEKASLKYNVSLADTSKLFQAIVGPGTAAKMTMEEIGKIAVIGTAAVKSMGLDSRQVVQEIRDLVQGGIQASSSTLATALGLKDSDIKRAKESAQGLFAFLEERMQGYTIMSMERNNTLSGAWDMLIMKAQRLFSDTSTFDALKEAIKSISDSIATIEYDSKGNIKGLKFDESMIAGVKEYMHQIGVVISFLADIAKAILYIGSVAAQVFPLIAGVYVGSKLIPMLVGATTTVGGLTLAIKTFGTAMVINTQLAVALASSVGLVETAMLGLSAASAKWVALSAAAKGGIIGLVLSGGYMLLDYIGLIDSVFGSLEDRAKKARDTIRGLSREGLENRLLSTNQQIKVIARDAITSPAIAAIRPYTLESGTLWGASKALEQLNAEKKLLESQLINNSLQEKALQQGAIIQEGNRASSALAENMLKNDPVSKRAQAIEQANKQFASANAASKLLLEQRSIDEKTYTQRMAEDAKAYEFAMREAEKIGTSKHQKISESEKWANKLHDESVAISGVVEAQRTLTKSERIYNELVDLLNTTKDKSLIKDREKLLASAEQNKISEKAKDSILAESKAREDLINKSISNTKSIQEQIDATKLDIEVMGKSKAERLAATAAQYDETTTILENNLAKIANTEANKLQIETLTKEIAKRKELKGLIDKKSDAQAAQDDIEKEQKAYENLWKKVDGFAHDAFLNIMDKGKNAFVEIGNTIKRSILELLYKMTVQKWIFNIGVAAGGSSSTIAQALGMSGDTGSWLSSGAIIKTVWDAVTKSGAEFVAGAAEIGEQIGYYAAKLVGASAETTLATAQLGSAIGTMASYAGAGLAGIAIGSKIGGDKQVLGLSATTTSAIGTTAGMIVGSLIPGLGTILGGLIGGALGGVLNAAFGMGPKQSQTTTLAGQFTGQGFGGQYQTPWTQQGGWFRSDKSGVDVQGLGATEQLVLSSLVGNTASVFGDLLKVSGTANRSLAGWSFAINRQVQTQEQQKQLMIDLANSIGSHLIPELTKFKKEGENLADTAVRMRDEFIITDSIAALLGKDTKTAFVNTAQSVNGAIREVAGAANSGGGIFTLFASAIKNGVSGLAVVAGTITNIGLASIEARDHLVNLMGGIQNLSATMDSYYKNFFSDTERHAIDLAKLTLKFAELGQTIPTSNAGFRQLIESQDLSTASGRQLFASLMALNGEFAALYPLAQQATTATNQLVSAWQSVTDAIFAEVGRIRGLLPNTAVTSAQLAATSARALGGDIEAAKLLPGMAKALLDITAMTASNATDLARIQGRTAASLEATGVSLAAKYNLTIPSFDVGTNYVPKDMLAQVHAGEEIKPRKYVDSQLSATENTNAVLEYLVTEIRSLRSELQAANIAIAQNTKDTAKQLLRWEGDGLPETRVVTQ